MNTGSLRFSLARYRCAGLLLVLLIASAAAVGQPQTGRLRIQVTDANQKAIPGATVTIRNVINDASRTATTSANGVAIFDGLPPGTYQASASASGFGTAVAEPVTVT